MMKTALEIIQRTRKRMNLTTISSIASVTDPDELQMIELLIAVCEECRNTLSFSVSKRSYSFDTVSSTTSYELPLDFYAPLPGTHYNRDENFPLIGPELDSDFNYLLYGIQSGTRDFTYRLFGMDQNPNSVGGQFVVFPTPGSAVTIGFEYISRHLFLPKNWTPSTAYSLNDEVNLNGNIYVCTDAGTSGTTGPSGTAASGIVDGGCEWGYDNQPYESPVSDTDLCIFDHDLVRMGLRAKWLEEKSGDFGEAKAEYLSALESAKTRVKGSFIGSFGRVRREPRYYVPYRNWSL